MSTKEENAKLNLQLGNRVKVLREKLGLSREELAECVDISAYFLIEIETGRKGVSNVTLCKLAEALCTTTDYLLTGRKHDADVSDIVAMMSTMEEPIVEGAERIIKAYLCAVNRSRQKKSESNGQ